MVISRMFMRGWPGEERRGSIQRRHVPGFGMVKEPASMASNCSLEPVMRTLRSVAEVPRAMRQERSPFWPLLWRMETENLPALGMEMSHARRVEGWSQPEM